MKKDCILVIGANGQLGTVLVEELCRVYGPDKVIRSDINPANYQSEARFEQLDVLDSNRLAKLIDKFQVTQIYQLAAILSARGESNPQWTWDINMRGFMNVLELAREKNLDKIYFPSSIAVFGHHTPSEATPQHTILQPTTMYGITKSAGEQLANYYFHKYQLDVRSLRYPGLISYQSPPGGGTTDYAVDIFHQAIEKSSYTCFLKEGTQLPMMYMPDAVKATIELMEAPLQDIRIHTGYNIQAMTFGPEELAAEIQKHIPDFTIAYSPDHRQQIAESWIRSMDDTAARVDWNWKPDYDLSAMTIDMLKNLKALKEKAAHQPETITL
jgi:nucleoside-diphosphate-sugar epimerase